MKILMIALRVLGVIAGAFLILVGGVGFSTGEMRGLAVALIVLGGSLAAFSVLFRSSLTARGREKAAERARMKEEQRAAQAAAAEEKRRRQQEIRQAEQAARYERAERQKAEETFRAEQARRDAAAQAEINYWRQRAEQQQAEARQQTEPQRSAPPPAQDSGYPGRQSSSGTILLFKVVSWAILAMAVPVALLGDYAQAVMAGCVGGIGLLLISKYENGSLGRSVSGLFAQQPYAADWVQSPYQSKRQRQRELRDQRRADARAQGVACCPYCGSTSLAANKKGYGMGKGVLGFSVIGPLGLAAGSIGRQKVLVTCLNCGKRFKPGKGRV